LLPQSVAWQAIEQRLTIRVPNSKDLIVQVAAREAVVIFPRRFN
jgi:hypothetical protein